MMNITLISSIVVWRWALANMIIGILITYYFYTNYLVASNIVDFEQNMLGFNILYLLLLFSSIVVMFLRPKQQLQETTEKK